MIVIVIMIVIMIVIINVIQSQSHCIWIIQNIEK